MRSPCRRSRTSSSFFLVMKKAMTASATITQTEFVPGPFRRFTDGCCESLPTESAFYSTHRESGAVWIIVYLWSVLRRLNLKHRQTIIQPMSCRNDIYIQLIYRSKSVFECPAHAVELQGGGEWWAYRKLPCPNPGVWLALGNKMTCVKMKKMFFCFFFPHHILWKTTEMLWKWALYQRCVTNSFSSTSTSRTRWENQPTVRETHLQKGKQVEHLKTRVNLHDLLGLCDVTRS